MVLTIRVHISLQVATASDYSYFVSFIWKLYQKMLNDIDCRKCNLFPIAINVEPVIKRIYIHLNLKSPLKLIENHFISYISSKIIEKLDSKGLSNVYFHIHHLIEWFYGWVRRLSLFTLFTYISVLTEKTNFTITQKLCFKHFTKWLC